MQLSLLRSIARHPLYRVELPRLTSRAPDDIWWVPLVGWYVTFCLKDAPDDVLLFILDGPGTVGGRIPTVRAALQVAASGPDGRMNPE